MGIISGIDTVNALSSGELSSIDSSLNILETAYIEVDKFDKFAKNKITTATTKSVLSGLSSARNNAYNNSDKIKVQFNPDSLSFSYAGDKDKQDKKSMTPDSEGNAPRAEAEDEEPTLSISFKLVFDRSTYIDSSVQPEVEQFLSIIKNPYVRQVTFYWGTMCYAGVVKSIGAEYVLFNSLGIPMRAIVDISIQIT
jgi:hypothetical protein